MRFGIFIAPFHPLGENPHLALRRDFERVECTTVCSVDPAGDDAGTGTPNDPLQTIQAGIAKVQAGVNVFWLDASVAERRLERNVWIADAAITTDLPSNVPVVSTRS